MLLLSKHDKLTTVFHCIFISSELKRHLFQECYF
jgi:hypothetical protein